MKQRPRADNMRGLLKLMYLDRFAKSREHFVSGSFFLGLNGNNSTRWIGMGCLKSYLNDVGVSESGGLYDNLRGVTMGGEH